MEVLLRFGLIILGLLLGLAIIGIAFAQSDRVASQSTPYDNGYSMGYGGQPTPMGRQSGAGLPAVMLIILFVGMGLIVALGP